MELTAYPVFLERPQVFAHTIIGFDKATFDSSKQLILYGDTIFNSTYDYSLFDRNDTDGRTTFYYSEYSRNRAMFGKKDYIVACGREFIKYEIITE